ncbi:MAG: hypothetical protein GWP09_01535 [Nitrospiraceae bacterium]|nr:hypothetical protein [Nitrospiraceae bacterium]
MFGFRKNKEYMDWDEFQLRYKTFENLNWIEEVIKYKKRIMSKSKKANKSSKLAQIV